MLLVPHSPSFCFLCFQSNHTGHAASRLSLFLETLLPRWPSLLLLVLCFCGRVSDAWNGPTPLPLPPLLIWSLLQIISGYDSCYIPSMEWATHSPLCASVSTSMGISLRIPSEYIVKSPQTLSGWLVFSVGEGLEPSSSLWPWH